MCIRPQQNGGRCSISMRNEMPWITSLITRFMGPTWGPAGANGTQVGPMLAPWSLLSGIQHHMSICYQAPWSYGPPLQGTTKRDYINWTTATTGNLSVLTHPHQQARNSQCRRLDMFNDNIIINYMLSLRYNEIHDMCSYAMKNMWSYCALFFSNTTSMSPK